MFENIIKFFKKLVKAEERTDTTRSKDTAKERLHLVLMQDRANMSADFLELMKQEIIEVIKKYIEVDEELIDVRLTNQVEEDGSNGSPALYANIPILNIKGEAKKEMDKVEKGKLEETKSSEESKEEEKKEEDTDKKTDKSDLEEKQEEKGDQEEEQGEPEKEEVSEEADESGQEKSLEDQKENEEEPEEVLKDEKDTEEIEEVKESAEDSEEDATEEEVKEKQEEEQGEPEKEENPKKEETKTSQDQENL